MADQACDQILTNLRKSGLNFVIQETPFSAYITIRKKFCNGFTISADTEDEQKVQNDKKVQKLENENDNLRNELQKIHQNFKNMREEKDILENRLDSAEKEILHHTDKTKLTNAKLNDEIHNLKEINMKYHDKIANLNSEISKQEKRAKSLDKVNTELETKNCRLTEQIERNEADGNRELREVINEKEKLEEKVNSLLDALYGGCPECGLDACECDVEGEGSVERGNFGQDKHFPPDTAPESFAASASLLNQPSSGSSPSTPPWTPPPTPPCLRCGGINYGPCAGDVCFSCLPPIHISSEHPCSSSPSRTPPGTPPPHRLEPA